ADVRPTFAARARGLWRRGSRRSRPSGPITALDLDGDTLHVVQAVLRGGGAQITRVAAAPLALPPEADRAEAEVIGRGIARALARLGIKAGPVVMGVPRAQVVLRTLALPMIADVRELASMVHFQIGRDLPFRFEDAVVDFKVRWPVAAAGPAVPASEAGVSPKLDVRVAAVKREVVAFHQQVAEAAGLRLAALGLLSYANARCVEACHVAEGDDAFALISLRPDEVNIDVIGQQSLLFSRGASVKSHAAPAKEPVAVEAKEGAAPATAETGGPPTPPEGEAPPQRGPLETTLIEVVRSLHAYSGVEPQNPVRKIVVTGATGLEAPLMEALSQRLALPCTTLDPAAAFQLGEDGRGQAAGAIAAMGLALGFGDEQGLSLDFLNPKRPAVQRDLRRIRVLAGVAAAAAIVVFVLAVRGYLIGQRDKVRRELAAELVEAEKKSPIYRRMVQQAAALEEWTQSGRNWLEHYAYLSAILPPSEEVYLTSLAVSGQGTIRLSVQARSGEILAKLDKQLRAAGYEVRPLAITPGADRHGYEFRSNVELVVPDKMRIDLSQVKTPLRPPDDVSLDPAFQKGGGG
ncbi:MAG TPA: pilus assembly protein PilM, partial [Methylomirabilota bacterium]|nr:pilus assembly protein PilM [Methylomirabilota bacterium]